MWCVWGWSLWDIMRFRWGYEGRALNMRSELQSDTTEPTSLPLSLSLLTCEGIVRRWPCTSQVESSHKVPTIKPSWSLASQAPELWEINICCFSYTQSMIFCYGTLTPPWSLIACDSGKMPKPWGPSSSSVQQTGMRSPVCRLQGYK